MPLMYVKIRQSEADKFAKKQMLLNKCKLAELLKIDENIIERFSNDIRKNKGAVD
jgi:hypothetical protein